MTEIDDVHQRLAALESSLEAQKDLAAAYQKLLFAGVRVIYKRDQQAVHEWIAEARASAAFGHAAFDRPPPELLPTLLDSLEAIVEALRKAGPGL